MAQVTVGGIVGTGADIHRTTAEQQAARAALQVGHNFQCGSYLWCLQPCPPKAWPRDPLVRAARQCEAALEPHVTSRS